MTTVMNTTFVLTPTSKPPRPATSRHAHEDSLRNPPRQAANGPSSVISAYKTLPSQISRGFFPFFLMIPRLSIPLYDLNNVDPSTFPSDRERDTAFYNLDTLCTCLL